MAEWEVTESQLGLISRVKRKNKSLRIAQTRREYKRKDGHVWEGLESVLWLLLGAGKIQRTSCLQPLRHAGLATFALLST